MTTSELDVCRVTGLILEFPGFAGHNCMFEVLTTSETTTALRRLMWHCCIAACGMWLFSGNVAAGFIHAQLSDSDPSLLSLTSAGQVAELASETSGAGALPLLPGHEEPVPPEDPEQEDLGLPAGMAADSSSSDSGPSSVPAAACLNSTELPLPTLTAWLHHGQYLAVPPAPRSGQCRPP